MMLDSKAPRFAMRGKLCDITPNAWEVKRRRLHTASLAAEARRATAQARLLLVLLLLLAFVLHACAPRASIMSHPEREYREPRHHATDWYDLP